MLIMRWGGMLAAIHITEKATPALSARVSGARARRSP